MTYELSCGIFTQFHVLEKDRKKTGASTIAVLRRILNVPQDICNVSILWLTFFSNNKQTLLSHTVVCIWTISCIGTSEIQNNELSIQSPAKERNGSLAMPDMFCSEINRKKFSPPLHPQITNLSFHPLFFSPHYISAAPFYSVNGGTLNTKESTRVYIINKGNNSTYFIFFAYLGVFLSQYLYHNLLTSQNLIIKKYQTEMYFWLLTCCSAFHKGNCCWYLP